MNPYYMGQAITDAGTVKDPASAAYENKVAAAAAIGGLLFYGTIIWAVWRFTRRK